MGYGKIASEIGKLEHLKKSKGKVLPVVPSAAKTVNKALKY